MYRGPKEGACSEEIALLKMAISSKLRTVQEKLPEPVRSGAYSLVTDFHIDDLSMNQLFWNLRQYDIHGNGDGMRNAVCSFVVENIELMKTFVPQGYPRKMDYTSHYDQSYVIAAICMGALAVILTLAIAFQTYHIRKIR